MAIGAVVVDDADGPSVSNWAAGWMSASSFMTNDEPSGGRADVIRTASPTDALRSESGTTPWVWKIVR